MLIRKTISNNLYYKVLLVQKSSATLSVIENSLIERFSNIKLFSALSISEGLELFHNYNFNIVIVSSELTNGDTPEFVKKLKMSKNNLPIVVVVDSGQLCVDEKLVLLDVGTTIFVEAPLSLDVLSQIVINLLKLTESHRGLERAENIIQALTAAIETRDPYTQGHAERVAAISVRIFEELGLRGEQKEKLFVGALLHDIGKLALPDEILKSDTHLSDAQRKVVNLHPERGSHICEGVHRLKSALPIIAQHHERLDGSGYPLGLKEKDIDFLAQIVGVADVFDALTSKRSYRNAMSFKKAFEVLDEEVEKGKINRMFVTTLRQVADEFKK